MSVESITQQVKAEIAKLNQVLRLLEDGPKQTTVTTQMGHHGGSCRHRQGDEFLLLKKRDGPRSGQGKNRRGAVTPARVPAQLKWLT